MPASDLSLLMDAAKEAGDIAKKFWRADPEAWDKPDNAGPVTEADLAVDAMLAAELRGARPEYGWLSEETTDTAARLDCERCFIIDPIDGTRSFMAGEKNFSHSLAIAENGVITAAVIFLPMLDEMYSATKGGGAHLNGVAMTPKRRDTIQDARILGKKPSLKPELWQGGSLPINLHFRSSLAYRFCLVASGEFDGMLSLHPCWEWDIAGGDLIAREAGAAVTDQHGLALSFNNPHPKQAGVFAAAPAVHQEFLQRLL
ncbi:MAG: 3'(2'),5'-bisphosphate nucleotidase CysQ [Paracoccaceae bacterium]|nr:3'(2'),5'-bisphosphate nucleotidase CysQ [Paracoccaceae bacterium]